MLRNLREKFPIFITVVWFFNVAYLDRFSVFNELFATGKKIALGIVILLIIVDKFRTYRKVNLNQLCFLILLLLYEGYIIWNTWANQGPVSTATDAMYGVVGMAIILNYWIQKEVKSLLSVLMFIFEILIYVNLLLVFLCPKGIYGYVESKNRAHWLLGHQNGIYIYVMCAILVSILYLYCSNKRKANYVRSLALIAASTIMVVKVWSATTLVGVAIIFLVLVLYRFRIYPGIKTGIVFSFLMFFGVVVYRQQSVFGWFIKNVLHRSMTFTGRTKIWDKTIELIKENPIWGYGYKSSATCLRLFDGVHPHNRYLLDLFQGGIILLVIFLLLMLTASYALKRSENTIAKAIIVSSICSLLIHMQMEADRRLIFFLPFIFAVNIREIERTAQMNRAKRIMVNNQKQ